MRPANFRSRSPETSGTVTNVGDVAGIEAVEIYVAPRYSDTSRPTRELKGFVKVELKPGESKTVAVPLANGVSENFDSRKSAWKDTAGDYIIEAGSSSRDIRLDMLYRYRG